jgi:exopolysaccharide production protein ExoF
LQANIDVRIDAGDHQMLDTTNSRLAVIDKVDWPDQQPPWRDGGFRTFVENVRQRRHMMMVLMLVGAAVGWVASLAYLAVRVPAYSASSEILISNTTLQLSGADAVVTQILVENSLVENAIELLRSSRVLGRVIDKVGLEEIERISPRHSFRWNASYWEPESSDASKKQASIALLRSNTAVKRVGSSQVVLVSARALTAMDAARLTNEIAAAFVQEQYDANAVVSTSAALRERIKVLGPTARIISEAVPPRSKDSPMAAIAMLLGIMLGGVLGAGSGLSLIGFDPRLRTAEQLAAVTSAECFGYVPRINPRSSKVGIVPPAPANRSQSGAPPILRHVTALEPLLHKIRVLLLHDIPALLLRKIPAIQKLFPSEPDYNFDLESILRRSLLRQVRSAVLERSTIAPRIVGVTSCRAGEGKTTLAANLARFIAREGTPVLLIDACCSDMKSGPAKKTPGLQQLLRGTATPDAVIRSDISLNLDFLPSGGPGDLDLLWGNLPHAINDGRKRGYQWIILDLPELATAIDVCAAGQVFDNLLIVVEWGGTSKGELQQGLRALGSLRERIVGTVINKVPWASIDSVTASLLARPGCDDHRSKNRGRRGTAMIKRRFTEIAMALILAVIFAAQPASALAGDYRLGVSDRVKIKVQEWPDISGEYTVTPDGAVSLPLIGNIDAVGLRLNDLAREISDRFQQRSEGTERVLAAVEIAQYRPFAITGDVQRPGQYPYRPGLTVIEAISIAGGYYRPELGFVRLGRDVAVANGEIHTQSVKLNRLIAHEARLGAALDGHEDIPLPPELAKQKDDPEILAIMKDEQAVLAPETEMRRSEQAALENIKSLYQNEITSLRGHVEALTQEQDSIGGQLKEMRSMAAKGLALAPTMFALERSLAQVASQQMATETGIVRAEESITLAEQRVTQAQQERSRAETKDLEKTKDEIAEARAKLETAIQLLHEAQISAPAEVRERSSENAERPGFTILRRDGETMREVVADETTLVTPDDIIKIPTVRLPPAVPGSFVNLSRADAPVR